MLTSDISKNHLSRTVVAQEFLVKKQNKTKTDKFTKESGKKLTVKWNKIIKDFLSEHCYVLLYNVADLFPFCQDWDLNPSTVYNQSWVFLLTKTLVDLQIVT